MTDASESAGDVITTFGVDERFAVRHQELTEFWKKGVGRTMASTTSFYHCNMSCISPRHPYFDIRSLAVSPETLLKLTADDVREIRESVVRHLVDGLDQACVIIHIRRQLCDILVKLLFLQT